MHCMDMLYVSSSSEASTESKSNSTMAQISISTNTLHSTFCRMILSRTLADRLSKRGVAQHSFLLKMLRLAKVTTQSNYTCSWLARKMYWLVQVVYFISRFWPSTVSQVSCLWESSVVAGLNAEYGCRRLCKCKYVLITLSDVLKLTE
jgi:hypothetical protein